MPFPFVRMLDIDDALRTLRVHYTELPHAHTPESASRRETAKGGGDG